MSHWNIDSGIKTEKLGGLLSDLSQAFLDNGFEESSAAKLLGAGDAGKLLRHAALYALGTYDKVPLLVSTPPGLLTQLFVRNGEVPLADYRHVLEPALRGLLEELELVTAGDALVSPSVSVAPFSAMYFLSDMLFTCPVSHGNRPVMHTGENLVMPPHATSLLLLGEIEPRDGRLLDIGTGSGILGITLSRHYAGTTGIDIDPRAVRFATMNALLNQCDVGFRVADFHGDPAGIGTWDHVVFNAPERTPQHDRSTMSSPLSGEAIIRAAARSITPALTPTGIAQILVSVAIPQNYSGANEVVTEWLRDDAGVGYLEVTELNDPLLRVPATSMRKGHLPPGSLLANGRDDAEHLLNYFKQNDIREVVSVIVSLGP
jgi:hypothetical protein